MHRTWYNRNQKYLPVKSGILLFKLKCRMLPMQDSGWVNANFTLVSRYRTKKKHFWCLISRGRAVVDLKYG